MDKCNFQLRQIVCLEHQATRLYGEVIQIVETRQVGWIRPLVMAEFPAENPLSGQPIFYDLRSSADLLWPLALFRPALDTEVAPLLLQLLASEPPTDRDSTTFARLYQFVHQVWQAQHK